jgi:recombination protein RecT
MMALPKHMTADRMIRISLTELRSNPKLQDCDPLSFFAAIIKSSQLGLELGLLGEAYLIPRKIKGKMEVTFQPGYKGIRKLAKNAGDVRSIIAHVVYENDEAELELGTEEKLIHKPLMRGERGELIWAYAVITYKDGAKDTVPMTKQEILHVRDNHSETYRQWKERPTYDDGNPKPLPAWVSDEAEMWKKTVILRACKQVELSPELKQAIEYDIKAEQPTLQNITADVFDITPPTEDEESQQAKVEDLKAKRDELKAKKENEPKTKDPDHPLMDLAPGECPDRPGDTMTVEFCQQCGHRDGCPVW